MARRDAACGWPRASVCASRSWCGAARRTGEDFLFNTKLSGTGSPLYGLAQQAHLPDLTIAEPILQKIPRSTNCRTTPSVLTHRLPPDALAASGLGACWWGPFGLGQLLSGWSGSSGWVRMR